MQALSNDSTVLKIGDSIDLMECIAESFGLELTTDMKSKFYSETVEGVI